MIKELSHQQTDIICIFLCMPGDCEACQTYNTEERTSSVRNKCHHKEPCRIYKSDTGRSRSRQRQQYLW